MRSPISRRDFLGGVAVAGASAALAGCSPGDTDDAAELTTVTIGTQNLMNIECIALHEGYFDDAMPDVEVSVVSFSSGRDLNQAMATGDVDFGIVGSLPTAIGLCNGIDYEVLYSTAILTKTEALVARLDAGISSISDLLGKTVATTFTSTCHYSLLCALAASGVDVDDVDLLDMQPESIVAAWSRGDIDAAYTWDPSRTSLVEDGGRVILTSGEVGDMGYPTADFALVRKGFAEYHPEHVVSYLEALLKAETLFNGDRPSAYEIIADQSAMDVEEVEQTMTDDYVTGESQLGTDYLGGGFAQLLVDMSEFLLKQGDVTEPLDLESASAGVAPEYLEEALES